MTTGLTPARVVAVDWSGARTGERQKLWLAEISDTGVERLRAEWTRESLTEELQRLVRWHRERSERLIIGLDFAFGFPAWYAEREGWRRGDQLWKAFDDERVGRLLAHAEPPFWGRGANRRKPASLRPDGATPSLRRTEQQLSGPRPFSVFQLVGAGSVGVGSLRGMRTLAALSAVGARVWPFHGDPGGAESVVLEIWPRLCAPNVVKSSASARRAHVAELHAQQEVWLPAEVQRSAERSDDAFDALTSALALWRARAALALLPAARDAQEKLEGRIWHPDVR
jgi:hypothetical protein